MALSLFKKYWLRENQLNSKKDVGVTKSTALDLEAYVERIIDDTVVDMTTLPVPASAGVTGQILTLTSATSTSWQSHPEVIVLVASDETTAISAGTAKVKYRMPFAMTITSVKASLSTTQSSGSIFTIDINDGGTTILSTKLTIDNGETTSTTAATAAVISDAALASDAEISVDVDQIGDGTAKGLKVQIIGNRS